MREILFCVGDFALWVILFLCGCFCFRVGDFVFVWMILLQVGDFILCRTVSSFHLCQ